MIRSSRCIQNWQQVRGDSERQQYFSIFSAKITHLHIKMSHKQIYYSDKYYDDTFEYR